MRYYLIGLILFSVALFGVPLFFKPQPAQAATHDVSLSTAVQSYLTFDISAGDTVAFSALTAGTPIAVPSTGTIVSATAVII